MKFREIQALFTLLVAVALSSCSGPLKGPGGGGGGTGTVSFTLVADTLPASPSILRFLVSISGVVLTPSTGSTQTLSFATPLVVDLMRLQSDSAFLGSIAKVPPGPYKNVQILITKPQMTFLNNTTGNIVVGTTICSSGTICEVTFNAVGSPTFNLSPALTIPSTGQGLGLDVNLTNSISLTAGTLSVNFTDSGTTNSVTAFTLPRTNSNLANGELELIEDITGVVSISGSSVTITPAAATGRLPVTASTTSATNYDPDPSNTHCPTGTKSLTACVANNEVASMDAVLNANGTLSIQEIEPLLATAVDTVEGTVVSITPASQTQFTIVVTDLVPAATNSLIGKLKLGDLFTINLVTSPNPFLVDTKGLPVASQFASNYGTFFGATGTTAIHLGQTVAVHVKTFTAASGTTPASATVDTVTLRWSRLIATPTGASGAGLFNITSLPSYFGFTQASIFGVQIFTGTPAADGVTNLDGIASGNGPAASPAVGIRALFLEDPTNSLNPGFFAAKVRQH
jgi:hypothetical protein